MLGFLLFVHLDLSNLNLNLSWKENRKEKGKEKGKREKKRLNVSWAEFTSSAHSTSATHWQLGPMPQPSRMHGGGGGGAAPPPPPRASGSRHRAHRTCLTNRWGRSAMSDNCAIAWGACDADAWGHAHRPVFFLATNTSHSMRTHLFSDFPSLRV
jgi:hypothetical protein